MIAASDSRPEAVPGAVRVGVAQAVMRARQLLEGGDLEGAETIGRTILTQRAGHIDASQILAAVAEKRGDLTAAIQFLRAALSGGGGDATLQMNLCRTLRQAGDLDQAREAGEAAVAIGTIPEALVDLADVYALLGQNERARELFERAIALLPDLARAHLGLSHTLLMKGDFAPGWAEYEWRYRLPKTQDLLPKFKQPQWNGMTLSASRLFVLCEQGYGDCFQFARYLPIAAARVRDLIVGVSAELKPIIERVRGPSAFYDRWETLPPFEFQITLSSLPHALGTTLETIPAKIPYLDADPAKVAIWRARLAEKAGGRATVGLVWHGRILNASRCVPLGALTPIVEMDNILAVSLQVGAGSEQLAQYPLRPRVFDAAPLLGDFGETAALMTALDHVVSIDTSAAHLAGALGRPAHVVLPRVAEWRWLERGSDSPWYPTLQLVRQTKDGDWTSVIARVAADLERHSHT